MISYDSKTKVLSLQMGYQSQSGIAISQIGKIDLKALSPQEQRQIVAVSKLVVAFANGNNILKATMKSESDKSLPSNGESLLARATRIITSRSNPEENPSANTTTD